jgi:TrmH family RNA methyltransferase
MAEIISSTANPLAKRVRALAGRKERRASGSFLVEGIQPVWQAFEAGADIEVLLVAPELIAGTAAPKLVSAREAAGTPVARLTPELFERLSDRRRASGLAAIVRARTDSLARLAVGGDSLFVVLHEVHNPGNLGTIIRTAASADAQAVVLLGHSADPHSPESVRASMGAIFAVPIVQLSDPTTFFDWAAAHRLPVVGTSPSADDNHWAVDYPLPAALLVGNEQQGLPAEARARAEILVRIPMVGTAESLNAAIATAIMLYEMRRPHSVDTR